MSTAKSERRDFSIMDLHPGVRAPFSELIMRATTIKTNTHYVFQPFEGFRSPERQKYLFTSTESTKADEWQSAHQFGFAVDFAGYWVGPDGRAYWTWDLPTEAWEALKVEADAIPGLSRPIDWDLGHICHDYWYTMKRKVPR